MKLKRLRLAVKDLLSLFRDYPAPATAVILGIAVALVTHIIAMGVIGGIIAEQKTWSMYNTVSFIGSGATVQDLNLTALDSGGWKNIFFFFESPDDEAIVIGWKGDSPENWFPLGEGRFLDSNSEEKEAYVSRDGFAYRKGETQTIEIGGVGYSIVGSASIVPINLTNGLSDQRLSFGYAYNTFLFIPIEDALNLLDTCENVCLRLHFNENTTTETRSELWQELMPAAPQENVFWPTSPMGAAVWSNLAFFVGIGVLCLLAYANIISMFWHLLSMQKQKLTVYNIVGAGRRNICFILLTQYIGLFGLSFGAALLLAAGFIPLFRQIKTPFSLGTEGILAVFAFDFIMCFAVSLPKISGMLPRHTRKSKRGGMCR